MFGEGKSLFHPRWKNTPDVYLPFETHCRSSQVPSLVWFCLRYISEFPDQLQLPNKLIYRPSSSPLPKSFRLIDGLFCAPSSSGTNDNHSSFDLKKLDPRLWAVVVQVFDRIPPQLRTYTLALNDELLPLIQGLKNTDSFSLITILELPGCDALTDNNVAELRCLHALSAFDASNTKLSSHGIVTLSRTLSINDPGDSTRKLRGPWSLRILRLKHCSKIDNAVYHFFPSFPLLAVIDLRGTKCRPAVTSGHMPFLPCKERKLFSSNLSSSLAVLQKLQRNMFSAPEEYQFIIRIKNLCHESVANLLYNAEHRHQASISTRNSWDDYTHHLKCDRAHIEDAEPLQESILKANMERYPDRPHTESNLPPMVIDSKQFDEHQTSQKYSDSYHTSLSKLKLSTLNRHSPKDRFEQTTESNSDSVDGKTVEPRFRVPHSRELYWYDADLQKANTYVPISLTKNQYEDDLMLYRQARPWHHLEKELCKLSEKESRSEGAHINAVQYLNTLGSRNVMKAQQGLQSMAALALRRRREENLQNESGSSCTQVFLRNPLSKKISQSQISQLTKVRPLMTQKFLRPTLEVSKPIRVTFEENNPAILMSQAQETTPSIDSTFWSGDAECLRRPDM